MHFRSASNFFVHIIIRWPTVSRSHFRLAQLKGALLHAGPTPDWQARQVRSRCATATSCSCGAVAYFLDDLSSSGLFWRSSATYAPQRRTSTFLDSFSTMSFETVAFLIAPDRHIDAD